MLLSIIKGLSIIHVDLQNAIPPQNCHLSIASNNVCNLVLDNKRQNIYSVQFYPLNTTFRIINADIFGDIDDEYISFGNLNMYKFYNFFYNIHFLYISTICSLF